MMMQKKKKKTTQEPSRGHAGKGFNSADEHAVDMSQ
jgi:hypothetical protein